MKVKRGDIFYVDLGVGVGSEQGGERPVIVIQNDVGNKYSPTTIVAALTSSKGKANLPTHIAITRNDVSEHKNSFIGGIILCEQLRTIDKRRLKERIAVLNDNMLEKLDKALDISIFNPE